MKAAIGSPVKNTIVFDFDATTIEPPWLVEMNYGEPIAALSAEGNDRMCGLHALFRDRAFRERIVKAETEARAKAKEGKR